MNKEDLLKEAKRRYPVGTVARSIYGQIKNFKVTGKPVFRDYGINNNICVKGEGIDINLDSSNGEASIYSDEKGWAKIISTPEFKLPEKWCVKPTETEEKLLVTKFINKTSPYNFDNYINNYIPHFQGLKFYNGYHTIQKGYTEITFEQFKQYVLK